MKTSNKILIGLLSTILFVMMAFMLDIRVFGEHRSERMTERKSKNLPVGDFKHIKIDNLRSIKISPSETNHIHFVAYNDTTTVNISFVVENDTLIIAGTRSSSGHPSYTLYASSKIESISANKSNIRISGLHQDRIQLKVTDGEINSFGSKENEFSHFKSANIIELNSRINFHNAKFDTLALDMVNSNAGFSKDINTVNASIKSKSQLHLKNVEKLELVKDKTSRIYMR